MNASMSPQRLDQLVLARFAATPAPRPADLVAAVRRFWPAASAEDVAAASARLERAGWLAGHALTAQGRDAARPLIAAGVAWKDLASIGLPVHALGWSAADRDVRKRLDERVKWAGAIVARDFGLIAAGDPPPTPSQVVSVLVWRLLGLSGKPARQLPMALAARFVADVLEADVTDWKRGLVQLAARSVVAPRAEIRAVRDGVVRAWLGGRSWTEAGRPLPADRSRPARPIQAAPLDPPLDPPPPSPPDLEGFARAVRDAARRASDGVFGDRKVFISALWRDAGGPLSLDEFKRQLVEANRRGLLRLYRADLVAEMDPQEVAASATHYLDATFHFVEREATP
jgi:hypothetical protein